MKKIVAIVIALAMMLSISISVQASNFSDTSGHKLEENINRAVEIGFINGFTDGTFRPDQALTRAQFCKMLCEALGVHDFMNLDFSDVKYEDWYYEHVSSAVAYGFITGFTDNTFRPNEPVTRYQAALILSRVIDLKTTTGRSSYSDSGSVPAWAQSGVEFAASSGFFDSFISDTFSGDRSMTRAEAATVLAAMHDSFDKIPVFVTKCGNLGTHVSALEPTPKGFHISGKGLFRGLGLERLASDDINGWLNALAPVMSFRFENPNNVEFMDQGELPFDSFTYDSEDTISINLYTAPRTSVPADFYLICELNSSSPYYNRYELVNGGVAVYTLDSVYTYKMTVEDMSFMKTIENGKIESYIYFRSNVDLSKLILAYSFCDEELNFEDTVYVSNYELKTDNNGQSFIRVTDIIDKMYSEASEKGNLPYSALMLFASDDDAKREAYFANTLYFVNNSTFDLTHNGYPSEQMGTLEQNGAMIVGLKLLDINRLLKIDPDFSNWVSMYYICDEHGNEVSDGFTFTVSGENIYPSELFSIRDIMSINMYNLDTFGQLTTDETVAPGVYSLNVTIGIRDDSGEDKYAENKCIVFEVK